MNNKEIDFDIKIITPFYLAAKSNNYEIVNLLFPSICTRQVESNLFSSCTKLRQVTIPSSIQIIGKCVFYDCSSLIQVTIPSSVRSIGSSSFGKYSSLEEI